MRENWGESTYAEGKLSIADGDIEYGCGCVMSAMDESDKPAPIISDDYDPGSGYSITLRIVRLVAIASDRDPTDLPPLGDVVEAGALDALINSRTIDDRDVSIEMTIQYAGYRIEIDANGTVKIYAGEGQ